MQHVRFNKPPTSVAPIPNPTHAATPTTSSAIPANVEEPWHCKKSKTKDLPTAKTIAKASIVVLAMESKRFTTCTFFKDLKSCASWMVAVLNAQSNNLGAVKDLLWMN